MAQAMPCDLCGEETAVLMQTNLMDGSTLTVGQACLLTFSLANASAFSEGVPADQLPTYHELMAGLVAALAPELLPPAPEAKPRGKGRGKAPSGAQVDADSGAQVDGDADSSGAGGDGSEALSASSGEV